MTTQTQDNLIQTAARLFHEQGYAATGVATILRESDTNPGSFYHFFPSKQALLAAVLDWYQTHLDPIVINPIAKAQPDPIERIFDLLAWYRQGLVQSHCRLGCPIGNLALELSDTHPQVRPDIHKNFQAWTAAVQAWLDQAAHQLPKDCDRHALAQLILTIMEGGLMQSRTADSLDPFDAGVTALRDYINRLTNPPPRPTHKPTHK